MNSFASMKVVMKRLPFALRHVLVLAWLSSSGVFGLIMDDEFLRVSNGTWHRSKRKMVSFETACTYIHEPSLPMGCQYNASISPEWKEDPRRREEREVLVEFFGDTGGHHKSWRSTDNWLVGDPCWDHWYGVTCDEHGHVLALEMSDNGLKGTLPKNFGRLQSLVKLDLSSTAEDYHAHPNLYLNRLGGAVPSLKDMTRLEELEISGNLFEAFPQDLYLNAPTLKSISASHNHIRALPRYLNRFTTLQVLDVSHNDIAENFPQTFGAMTEIRFVFLQYNLLTGVLPQSLSKLVKIRVFDLSHNAELGGEFPKDVIPTWSEVEYLSVLNTTLEGYIPSLCIDVPFCYKFMFDTHGDLTWAVAGEVPDIVTMTLALASG